MKSMPLALRRFFVYGLFGGTVATIATFIGTSLLGLPFPPEAVFQLLISPVPGSIQSVIVETFREYGKYGAFTFAAAIYVVGYGLFAVLVGSLFRNRFQRKLQALAVSTLIPTGIGLGLEASLAPRASILSTPIGWLMAAGLLIVVNIGYAAIVVNEARAQRYGEVPRGVSKEGERLSTPSRRGFLKKLIIAAVVLAVAAVSSKIGLSLLSGQPVIRSDNPIPINNQPQETDLPQPPAIFRDPRIADLVGSEVTDNRIFYRVDINPIPPQLNFDQWSLKVTGKVNSPLVLNEGSLLGLATKDEYATLECVSNTINPPGALISNAKWTGVPLATMLDQAGISSDAKYVVFRCADGYSVGIPLDRAMQAGALLAYKMNDEPLPKEHGFPLRAIAPGIYGMMNAKWITEIEVVDHVYLGYWQERGWSNDAKIKTTSITYYPEPEAQINGSSPIAGVAFAGDRGISKVEVSTDGGTTWKDAILKTPRSSYSWVLWAYEWTPTTKGKHTIVVRAIDGTGQIQDPAIRQPFPEGATGYHSITLTVT